MLTDIWKSNKGILSLLKSELSDESKQAGLLAHSRQLFKVSWKLFYSSAIILVPSAILYGIYIDMLSESQLILWISLTNIAGILIGLYLFRKRK